MQAALPYALVVAVVLGTVTPTFAAGGRRAAADTGGFVIEKVENPVYHSNEIFTAFEDYGSPRVQLLRQRYRLDEVVAGETDEFKRQLLLRHWINQHIAINNDHPTPTAGDAFAILDSALKGGQFHCAHFMVVQHAVMNSMGYVCRSLGVGPGEPDDGGHHGVNEVWSDVYAKWYVSDAKYDIHFESEGVPLSALDIRAEHRRNGGADVVVVRGPERTPVPAAEGASEGRTATYNWPSWHTDTNSFSTWPTPGSSALVVYEDEYTRTHTWYRDGRPAWAYQADFFIPVRHRDWIEWTPNVVDVTVAIEPGPSNTRGPGFWAKAQVRSFTPNFNEYQLKVGQGDWYPVEPEFAVPLYRDVVEFRVRSCNLFGVTGPEHLVRISRKT